ncbi:FRG domain-containing protein [Micrococcus luteus]|uniref:FRG domain-containing protein n=1 Tax=Micrococcus luteus TaxID=1270 RepID=UPI0034E5F9CE
MPGHDVTCEEQEVRNLSELVSHIEKLHEGHFWYRGQGSHHHRLIPSIGRTIATRSSSGLMNLDEILELEERLINRFGQRSLPYWPHGFPQSAWEKLFTMQHYGLPTRLLDWSTNVLMAASFAAMHRQCQFCREEGMKDSCRPTIWILQPREFNSKIGRLDGTNGTILSTTDQFIDSWSPGAPKTRMSPTPVALFGSHNNDRIVAQSGNFVVLEKSLIPWTQLIRSETERL